MSRTLEQIQQEYSMAALQLGNLSYQNIALNEQIEKNDFEIKKLQGKMKSLNKEGAELNKKNEEATSVTAE